jgi:hypothetical protein
MKSWTNLPPWTSQYSVANRVDAMDCLSESLINVCYMVTGFDSSPRALANLAKTTTQGNSEYQVLQAVKNYGLIPYFLWPSPDDFDWQTYYSPIPDSVLNKSFGFTVKTVGANLNISPLWTILRFPNGNQHGVCQINQTEYFDSEQGSEIKPLTYGGAVVISQTSLIFTPMTNAKLVKNGNEWGFYLPATNDATLIDKALNLNYPLPTLNGSQVDWPQVKPDLTIS